MSSRYNPFVELERLFDRMSRQFAEASESWDPSEPMGRWGLGTESLRLDLVDNEDEFVATVDVPGFERDDIEVRVSDQTLSIDASREEEREESDERYLKRERHHRTLRRSIEIPEDVDEDAVSARIKNGVLTITMPKSADEDSRAVEIDVD